MDTKTLASFGIGLVTALVSGKIQKSALPQGGKNAIPVTNTVGIGIGAGAITGEPIDTMAAMIGSIIATGLHQLIKRLKNK